MEIMLRIGALCFFSLYAVSAPINIARNSDLLFGESAQGDPGVTIPPTHPSSARFQVRGDPNAKYQILLPQSIVLRGPNGGTIDVNNFQSQPSLEGQLDGNGRQTLTVGATHAPLSLNQPVGSYNSQFTAQVRYLSNNRIASANTQARQRTIASITITKLSDLSFGESIQGDPAKIIPPTSQGASFRVTGERNRAYSILLPSNVNIRNSTGQELNVSSFQSNPANTSTLKNNGSDTLFIGATLQSLSQSQAQGNYSGTFTVSVAYP